MRSFLQRVIILVSSFLSIINKIIPKNDSIILFYTNPSYNDNVMALLVWCKENLTPKNFKLYSCVKVSKCNEQNNIYFISRLTGLFIFLKAKYVFYDIGTTRIKPSKDQIVVQLWHGTPLKKIGRDVSTLKKSERMNDFSFVITTSNDFINIFADVFECSKDNVKVFEYPRNDYLLKPEYEVLNTYQKSRYEKNILWMPTFRKSFIDIPKVGNKYPLSLPIFEKEEELQELNERLKSRNYYLTIKLHPADYQNSLLLPEFTNIKIFNKEQFNLLNVVNYSFVSCFDVLITDYSSIYFDWLLLNRPIAFTIDDIAMYSEKRGFIFDNPLEYMPGEIISDSSHFYQFIDKISENTDEYGEKRRLLKEKMHSVEWHGDACKSIMDAVFSNC